MNKKTIFQITKDVTKDLFINSTGFGIGIGMLAILIMKDVFNN
jgi:hypothetical protein